MLWNRHLPLVIAGIVIIAAGFQLLPMVALRWGAVAVLLSQVFWEQRTNNKQFLTSPLFLLGALSLLLFSFILGLADTSFPGSHMENIETYFGSDAERMFVIFGLTCIAAHGLIAGCAEAFEQTNAAGRDRTEKQIYIFATIAVIVTLANFGNHVSLKFGGHAVTTIRSVAPPLLAFCLIYLVRQAALDPGRHIRLITVVMVFSIAGLLIIGEGKKPLLMIVAGLLYWLRLKDVSLKKLVITGVAFGLFGIIVIQVVQMIRLPDRSMIRMIEHGEWGDTPASMFQEVLMNKLIVRQTETRYCFHNIIRKHRDQPFVAAQQLFWLKGLVPRALWPEKPNLSLGQDYAYQYCGIKAKSTHTASITLLGQPVIQGGWVGLLLHGGVLIGCLGGMVWLARNPYRLATVTVVALLPWLIDFDQDFALYAANAVKFFLVMLPLVFVAARSPPGTAK